MHFSAPTPWQSYLFCKGLRIKQPCFEEPVFEYASSAFVPLQETQARGERMNAMCKSCGHHLSGFPNSRCLDISRTDARSRAPIASPDGINTQLSGVYSDFKHLYTILHLLTSSMWGFIHLNTPPPAKENPGGKGNAVRSRSDARSLQRAQRPHGWSRSPRESRGAAIFLCIIWNVYRFLFQSFASSKN